MIVGDLSDDALLQLAAGNDSAKLAQLRARVAAGEPAAYVAGLIVFRGRRYRCDRRAFITDPETGYLTDVVIALGRRLALKLGRPLRVVEFGVGAGTLALTVKHAQPDWELIGLDVDRPALELAAENAAEHGLDLRLIESDYLAAWPADQAPPDLIFGDPPWGGEADLYDSERDANYYHAMPARSAFPPGGGRCTIHDELIRQLATREWPSTLLLNYGVLPDALIATSAAPLRHWRLKRPQPALKILVGRATLA